MLNSFTGIEETFYFIDSRLWTLKIDDRRAINLWDYARRSRRIAPKWKKIFVLAPENRKKYFLEWINNISNFTFRAHKLCHVWCYINLIANWWKQFLFGFFYQNRSTSARMRNFVGKKRQMKKSIWRDEISVHRRGCRVHFFPLLIEPHWSEELTDEIFFFLYTPHTEKLYKIYIRHKKDFRALLLIHTKKKNEIIFFSSETLETIL